MKIRRAHVPLVLLGLAACNGDSTGPVDLVATVVISPDSPVTDVGLGLQFTAEGRDAGGAVISGVTATWSSSRSTVASISEDGFAAALSIGSTTITATIGSVSATAELTVEPTQCTGLLTVQLAPGDHQTFDSADCLRLPAGAPQTRYRIALIRPTQIGDPEDTPTATLRINPVVLAAEAPVAGASTGATTAAAEGATPPASRGTRLDGTSVMDALAFKRRTLGYHMELRERERELGLGRARRLESQPRLAGPVAVDPPSRADLRLGIDLDCEDTTTSPVALVGFNDDLAIYQDSVERLTKPISVAATDRMLEYYSAYIVDMSNQYWGQTPDIDGNARVLVTTSPELADSVAAAVFSGDLVSEADCASSNEAELIYFSADVIRLMDGSDPRWIALGTLAHEAKHVTSLYHGVARDQPRFHPLWIEEGTAEVAAEMSSRIAWSATGGPPVGARITGEQIVQAAQAYEQGGGAGGWPPEIDGVIGNIAALIPQLSTHPNSLLTNPEGADELHSFYAAGWHMNRFVGDAWGDASSPLADSALFRELTDSTSPAGAAGLAQLTGRTFEQLFEDLAIAISLHDVAGVAPPTRAFTTYDLVSTTGLFEFDGLEVTGLYPWPLTSTENSPSAGFASATFSEPVGPSGMQFYDFVSDGGLDAQVQVTVASGAKLVVTRLQ